MALGKTTIGSELATRLNMPFVDTDKAIEMSTGRTISQIFEEGGESKFRDIEADVVAHELSVANGVISLGGGAILREETRMRLKDCDCVIWLQADVRTIAARLSADTATESQRPNLTTLPAEEEIRTILTQRTPLYSECASLEIDTESKSPTEVVDEILGRLPVNVDGGKAK